MHKDAMNFNRLNELSKVSNAVLTAKPIYTARTTYRAVEKYSSPFLTSDEKKEIMYWCSQQYQHPVFQQSNAVLGM